MHFDDADFSSDDPFVRYNAHQAAKGRPQLPDPDEVRKAQKEGWAAKELKRSEQEIDKPIRSLMPVSEFLDRIGTNMGEMAEVQEKIERGEIDDPSDKERA